MYALLLIPKQGVPGFMTMYDSREDFLATMQLRNTPDGWREAAGPYRVILEIASTDRIPQVLRRVKLVAPDQYDRCRRLLERWAMVLQADADEQEN